MDTALSVRDVIYDLSLPCDTLLHNCSLEWAAFIPVKLSFRSARDNAAVDAFAVLRAVRRADLDPSDVCVPAWLVDFRQGPARDWSCWLAEAPVVQHRRYTPSVRVHVQLVGIEQDVTVAPVALERCLARALRGVTASCVRAGLLIGVPVAGRFIVAQVSRVEEHASDDGGTVSVRVESTPTALTALERALLLCYGPVLQPRMAHLLRAHSASAVATSALRSLLLVAHVALMPAELCVLIAKALGAPRVTVLHAEELLQSGGSAPLDGLVVLSGLECLAERDSHTVAQWLDAIVATAVVVILVHNLEDVSRDLISPSRVGVAVKLHAPTLAQRTQIVAMLAGVTCNDADAHAVAALTGGFSVRDVRRFCDVWIATSSCTSRACLFSYNRRFLSHFLTCYCHRRAQWTQRGSESVPAQRYSRNGLSRVA